MKIYIFIIWYLRRTFIYIKIIIIIIKKFIWFIFIEVFPFKAKIIERIEVFPFKAKSFLIGVIYRPPDTSKYLPTNFQNKFKELLNVVSLEQKETILTGDVNVNFLDKKSNKDKIKAYQESNKDKIKAKKYA